MRTAEVFLHDTSAGFLTEVERGKEYKFKYHENYDEAPISVTMPVEQKTYYF